MNRRNCMIIVALASVALFSGNVCGDEPKPGPDQQPRLVAQLGQAGGVYSVAFSPDGKQALIGSGDKLARLWDVSSGKEIRTFMGHSDAVSSVSFSPDGKQALTASWDRTARLWDVQSGKEIQRFAGHSEWVESAVFSPDGKQALTGSWDKTGRLWDVQSGKEIRRFTGHASRVSSVAFSPDGKRVMTGSEDSTARLWDVQSGKEIQRFTGRFGWVHSVTFSPDGTQVLTGSDFGETWLWDIPSGKKLRIFTEDYSSIESVAFSPDGKQILTGNHDKTVRLWDVRSGQVIHTFNGHTIDDHVIGSGRVYSVKFSPDGKQVLTGSADNTARLWDTKSGKEIRTFMGRAKMINSASFSPDGKQVLTGSSDKTARLWDIPSSKVLRSYSFTGHSSWVASVVLSPGGNQVLTGSDDKTARLWDMQSGKQLRAFTGHTDKITSAAISPDGKQVLTGSDDKTARLWDAQSGQEIRSFTGDSGFLDTVSSVAFSPDGKQVLAGTSDGIARLWDVQSGQEIRKFTGHSGFPRNVVSVAFSPDGKHVMTGSADHTARLWDTRSGKEIRCFTGHSDWVHSVAFSLDGKQVLTGSSDNTARLWDTQSGQELHILMGHTGWVTSVKFSPDGRQVLTGSADSTTRIWGTQSGRELCRLISFADGGWAVADNEGRFDASNGGDVEGLHWVVGLEPIALKQLKERYYDPGLLAKHMGFNKEPLRDVAAFRDVKLFPELTRAEVQPDDKKLTLNLTNRGGGIGRIQVFVNGKELLADARGPKPDPDARTAAITVDLSSAHLIPGKSNQVEIVTWNAEGYLSSRGLTRNWTPEGQADASPPELYIIVCGVSDYAEPKLNLRFAAKDAEDMAHALELAGKKLFGADKVHLTLLATGDKRPKPTKENIRKAFEALRKARPADLLVVYLAGHGIALKQGGDEYCYLTADARGTDAAALSDPAVLGLWAVTSSELVDWIKQIPALKQVMLLDTCAAGAAAAKLLEHRDLSGDQVRALDRLKDRTGFHVLMGCAADRVSYEASQYSQGLLTYSLLQAMAGARLREGEYVDVSGLFQYAADEVPQLARGIGGVQKPLVIAPRGVSFDIGRLVEADRKTLPLAKPKPLILRPLLGNAEDGDDNLKLGSLLRKRLADDSFITARGNAVATVYVDADELAGAVRPAGTYTVDGKKVTVRLVLKQDGETLKKATVEGSIDDLPGLTVKLADAIREGIAKP